MTLPPCSWCGGDGYHDTSDDGPCRVCGGSGVGPDPNLVVLPRDVPGGERITRETLFEIDRGYPTTICYRDVPIVAMDERTLTLDLSKASSALPWTDRGRPPRPAPDPAP